jgi:hypothetical protein
MWFHWLSLGVKILQKNYIRSTSDGWNCILRIANLKEFVPEIWLFGNIAKLLVASAKSNNIFNRESSQNMYEIVSRDTWNGSHL